MPNLPWFKVYTEILDNYKLRSLSDAQKWRFLQLLALAGECGSKGYLVHSDKPLQVIDIAWRLRLGAAELLKDLQNLASQELIHFDEATGAWLIPSFASRQARQSEETREYWREQKRRKQGSSQPARVDDLENEVYTQPTAPDLPLDAEEGSYDIEETNQNSFIEGSPCDGIEDLDQDDSPVNLQEKFPETFQEPFPGTFQEQFPLKRRIEKKRGEKREKERRRGERQRPPPVGRSKPNSAPNLSVFDEVERELAKKCESPPLQGRQETTMKNLETKKPTPKPTRSLLHG